MDTINEFCRDKKLYAYRVRQNIAQLTEKWNVFKTPCITINSPYTLHSTTDSYRCHNYTTHV